ncbi:MAG: family 16 glycoside hydrolase, partial [Cyclobacteriaceae bacterium]
MRYSLICLLAFIISCTTSEKPHNFTLTQLPSQKVSLTDLSAFKESPANWQIAGSVYADRHQERAIESELGTGILVNSPQESTGKNLFTAFEHGDLDVELEFMMATSSNSGVYLQGRYEVQLLDSWGEDSVRFADCGGIYQRWQNEQGFGGVPPRTNACYAPGLWQHLSVKFEAPRFDAQGKKVRDALFRKVVLNGVVIHENVSVSGPTRAAAFDDEQALGPLMLQGDHGPVAFRNIRYKRYGAEKITFSNIEYEFYEGKFLTADTLTALEPTRSGQSDSVSYHLAQQPQEYALIFSGTLTAPTSGDYLMALRTAGASWLWIDNQEVVDHTQGQRLDEPGYGEVHLDQGEHSFKLIFSKPGQGWWQGLAWEYEGPEIPVTALHAPGSVPIQKPPPPHVVEVSSEPALQRGFWWLDEETKKTHTIAVGLPSAVNYVYDLRNGALLSA